MFSGDRQQLRVRNKQFFFFLGGVELGDRREGATNPHPEQRTKSEQKAEFSDDPKQNGQLMTKHMASTTFGGGGGKMRLQLDVAKKSVQFKYKNCNNAPTHSQFFFFLLRAYHSMQSTLPCHRGSRGALQQQWEEKTLKKAPVNHGVSSCFLEVQPFRYFRGENSKKFQMSKCTSHAAKLKGRGH